MGRHTPKAIIKHLQQKARTGGRTRLGPSHLASRESPTKQTASHSITTSLLLRPRALGSFLLLISPLLCRQRSQAGAWPCFRESGEPAGEEAGAARPRPGGVPGSPSSAGKLCRGGRTYPARSRGSAAAAGPWPRGRSGSAPGAGRAPRPRRCQRGGPGADADAAPPGSGPAPAPLPRRQRGAEEGEALPWGNGMEPGLSVSPSRSPEARPRERTVPKECTEQSGCLPRFP